jgi:hypothetical protein
VHLSMSSLFSDSPISSYGQYLQQNCPTLKAEDLPQLSADLAAVNWDDPESALDLNNFAVMQLIEAEQTQDPSLRTLALDLALEALSNGVEMQPTHPLCSAHLALLRTLIGEGAAITETIFSEVLLALQSTYYATARLPLGLVYLPPDQSQEGQARRERLEQLVQLKDGQTQALIMMTEVLCQAALVFYSNNGKRFLRMAHQLTPDSAILNLRVGLSSLVNHEWEGLLSVYRANQLLPDYAPTIQTLYLVHRELQVWETANFWLQVGRDRTSQTPDSLNWRWAALSIDSPFTYIPFDHHLLLSVDPSIHSIVTSVLLAEGDWFEAEMEFWRNQLQPGMVVIDVGANVGVYTVQPSKSEPQGVLLQLSLSLVVLPVCEKHVESIS